MDNIYIIIITLIIIIVIAIFIFNQNNITSNSNIEVSKSIEINYSKDIIEPLYEIATNNLLNKNEGMIIYGELPDTCLFFTIAGFNNNELITNSIIDNNDKQIAIIISYNTNSFIKIKNLLLDHEIEHLDYYDLNKDVNIYPLYIDFNEDELNISIILKYAVSRINYIPKFYKRIFTLNNDKFNNHIPKIVYETCKYNEFKMVNPIVHKNAIEKNLKTFFKIEKVPKIYCNNNNNNYNILEFMLPKITIIDNMVIVISAIDHVASKTALYSIIHIFDLKTDKIIRSFITSDNINNSIKKNEIKTHLIYVKKPGTYKIIEQIFGSNVNNKFICPMICFKCIKNDLLNN